jgi:hypothetical protein
MSKKYNRTYLVQKFFLVNRVTSTIYELRTVFK